GDFERVLRLSGPFTLFAPTNEAFSAISDENLAMLQYNELALKVLGSQMGIRTLLAGHLVSGRLLTMNFLDKQKLRSLSHNKMLRTTLYNMSLKHEIAISRPQRETRHRRSNGVIHVINKVLIPPKLSILTYLQSQGNFSRFIAALNKTVPSLLDLLESDNAPFTVFAVTDSDTYSMFAYDKMMAGTLVVNSIMRNHVLPDTLFTSALVPGNYYQMTTLNSEPLLVRRLRGSVYADTALLVKPDILCTNGVIHIVNKLIQLDSGYDYS
ncbi:hypothetical protein L9F63_001603, partial [Diploptera punctata]